MNQAYIIATLIRASLLAIVFATITVAVLELSLHSYSIYDVASNSHTPVIGLPAIKAHINDWGFWHYFLPAFKNGTFFSTMFFICALVAFKLKPQPSSSVKD